LDGSGKKKDNHRDTESTEKRLMKRERIEDQRFSGRLPMEYKQRRRFGSAFSSAYRKILLSGL
jgi:hypothetical protein